MRTREWIGGREKKHTSNIKEYKKEECEKAYLLFEISKKKIPKTECSRL
jgi:hypothetical protein